MPTSMRIFATIAVLVFLPTVVAGVLASNNIKNANGVFNLCLLALLIDIVSAAIWAIWTTT